MKYTATDIIEACGLEPAGARRTVMLAATALELALRHEISLIRLRVPRDWSGVRGVRYPPGRRVYLAQGVWEWSTAMSKELELDVAVAILGKQRCKGIEYRVSPTAEWIPIPISMKEPERAADWWRECTYPLGPRQAQ